MIELGWRRLSATGEQPPYFVSGPDEEIDAFVARGRRLVKGAHAFILRGERCVHRRDLFDEWAAALQFPSYFGYNWDAFEEMVHDLRWLPARAYFLFLTRTDQVLAHDGHAFRILTSILAGVSQDGVRMVLGGVGEVQGPASVHIVYQANEERSGVAALRLEEARAGAVPALLREDPMPEINVLENGSGGPPGAGKR